MGCFCVQLDDCCLLSFPGYYGKGCTDACHLNPCENEAQCHRKHSSSHGYICDCGDNHYGQYCQHRYTHTRTHTRTHTCSCGPGAFLSSCPRCSQRRDNHLFTKGKYKMRKKEETFNEPFVKTTSTLSAFVTTPMKLHLFWVAILHYPLKEMLFLVSR